MTDHNNGLIFCKKCFFESFKETRAMLYTLHIELSIVFGFLVVTGMLLGLLGLILDRY
jgi:hypothetical protein